MSDLSHELLVESYRKQNYYIAKLDDALDKLCEQQQRVKQLESEVMRLKAVNEVLEALVFNNMERLWTT